MAAENQLGARTFALVALLAFGTGFVGGIAGTLLTLRAIDLDPDLSDPRRAPDEVVKVGETLTLRSDSGRGVTKAFLSRPSLRVRDGDRADVALVTLEATTPGLTTLTLVDDRGAVTKVRILVQP